MQAAIVVSPLALNFGEVAIGSAQDLSLTLQNTGEDILTGTIGGPPSPFSVVAGGGNFSLTAGASVTVTLRFAPTSTESFGGAVDISSTGGSASILLSGVGTAGATPALSVCSSNLNFGQVALGQSVDLTCAITNTGTRTLTGSATTVPPFSLESGDPFNLTAGQSQSVVVRFTPGSAEAVEDVLTVTSNGGSASIVLHGTGVQDSVLAVNPTRLNFGSVRVGQSRDLSLTVQNIGGGTLSHNVCVPSGFRVVSADTFSLSAGQSQAVTIRFNPPRASAFNGTVTFTSNPCNDENPQPDSTTAVISGVGVEEVATGQAYVANRGSNTVSVVNTATQVVEATILVGSQPVALALTPDARTLYVVNFGSNDVSVVDTASRQETQRIAVGLNPIDIVISADGQHAYVANAGPGEDSVSILDLGNNQLLSTQKIRRPVPTVLALSPDGNVLYILGTGSNLVGLLETTTNQKARVTTGNDPVAVAFSPDGDSAYIVNQGDNTASVLDARTFPPSIVCDVVVEDAPVSVAVSPDGEKVYVANSLDDSLSVFNPCVPIQVAPSAVGQANPKETLASNRIAIPNWLESTNLQFDPNFPSQMLVVNSTSNNVGLLDIATDEAQATILVGTTPEQSAFDTEMPQAVVTNFGSNNVSLVNTNAATSSSIPVGDAPVALVFSYFDPVLSPPPSVLENPQPDSFQSGIGVISGFVCDASQILIEFNATATFEAAYGTSRGDTESVCGDANNGFSLLFNWNLLGTGTHTVRALADGIEFANVTITVTTLGAEFRTDLSRTVTVPEFPMPGQTASLRWQQGQQNFVIFSGAGGGGGSSGDAQRVLENPPPGSFQSGVGVISGFVCNANQILIEFDGVASFEAAYGTSRGDTQTVCGDANNGFSLLFNWNLLGNGMHAVRAFADGVMFAEVAITVTTLGSEFRTGLSGTVTVPDFPQAGQTTSLRWQQSLQNFVIDGLF